MRPAIDGDAGNVALDIETRAAQRTIQLSNRERFIVVEAHFEDAPHTELVLLSLRQARCCRQKSAVQYRWLVG